jgi:hypothetical protein
MTVQTINHEKKIIKLVNNIFYDIADSPEVREQKEELRIHLSERVNEYMAHGLDFEDALAQARESLGDPQELVEGFERKKAVQVDEVDDDYGVNISFRMSRLFMKLTPLSPFIYVILGITQSTWRSEWLNPLLYTITGNANAVPNWWARGWILICVAPILGSGSWGGKIVACSPFIYVLMGVFFGWWLWGWLIIPMSAIIFQGGGKKKKKKRKKVKVRMSYDGDWESRFEARVEGMAESIAQTVESSVETALESIGDAVDMEFDEREDERGDRRSN